MHTIRVLHFKALMVAFLLWNVASYSQEGELPDNSEFKTPATGLWVNTYGNLRISKRLFWDAQTHIRFTENAETAYFGSIAQIYNRHAIGYIFNKSFNASLGGVVRINYNNDLQDLEKSSVPEWRIWHQYQFAVPLGNSMFYHRIRIEHRWSKGFDQSDDYIFRNRWRYMFRAKFPLNKPKLQPGAFYLSPESELILQSGKPVIGSVMEDLRLTTTLGYIINPRLSVAAGFMYSHGQTLDNPGIYKQGFTARIHLYFAPDLRRIKNKLPEIHFTD